MEALTSHTPPPLQNAPPVQQGSEFPPIILPFNTDFYEIRKTILELPAKETYSRIFANTKELEQFLLYISDAFKKKGSGKRNLTCQCNETKSAHPSKKPTTATTIKELQSPSRNRKSKLIPRAQQCEASLKIDKDPGIARIVVTAHTCTKQFPKFPKFLTDAIDRLLEAQLAAGASPPVARSVINSQIRNSILISLASQSASLTKHINNRCMKLIKPSAHKPDASSPSAHLLPPAVPAAVPGLPLVSSSLLDLPPSSLGATTNVPPPMIAPPLMSALAADPSDPTTTKVPELASDALHLKDDHPLNPIESSLDLTKKRLRD